MSTKIEELVNHVKEDEARIDQLNKKMEEEKRCVETAMNTLLEYLEEEKAKNDQLGIEMKTRLSAVEEELRKAVEEKEKAVREKEEIQLEVNLRKQEAHETINTNINRLINLDNTLKNMLKTKVALLFLILKKERILKKYEEHQDLFFIVNIRKVEATTARDEREFFKRRGWEKYV